MYITWYFVYLKVHKFRTEDIFSIYRQGTYMSLVQNAKIFIICFNFALPVRWGWEYKIQNGVSMCIDNYYIHTLLLETHLHQSRLPRHDPFLWNNKKFSNVCWLTSHHYKNFYSSQKKTSSFINIIHNNSILIIINKKTFILMNLFWDL